MLDKGSTFRHKKQRFGRFTQKNVTLRTLFCEKCEKIAKKNISLHYNY